MPKVIGIISGVQLYGVSQGPSSRDNLWCQVVGIISGTKKEGLSQVPSSTEYLRCSKL